jgi:transposase
MADDGFCFAPLVLSEGNVPPVPVRSDQPGKSEAQILGPIEIAVGQVTIRLDGATTATRVAAIVRAIGPSS